MDPDKAFECVDHLSMLYSLISMGISGRIITWIEDFLSNRKIKVKIQGTISTPMILPLDILMVQQYPPPSSTASSPNS
jgi:S-adenosylmethionine synthetase